MKKSIYRNMAGGRPAFNKHMAAAKLHPTVAVPSWAQQSIISSYRQMLAKGGK